MCNGSRSGGNIYVNDRLITWFNIVDQMMDCATSFFGLCGHKMRPHQFYVDVDKIWVSVCSSFHHYSRGKIHAMN